MWRNSAVAGSLIVAAASLFSLALDGCNSERRQRAEFQSQLILQGIEADDPGQAVKYFRFITDLGLLDDPELEAAIESYVAEPESIPIFGPLGPVAVNDTVRVDVSGPVLIDVLENDSDPLGRKVTISSFGNPRSGAVEQIDNALRYSPEPGFVGESMFFYRITNGAEVSNRGQVTILVE